MHGSILGARDHPRGIRRRERGERERDERERDRGIGTSFRPPLPSNREGGWRTTIGRGSSLVRGRVPPGTIIDQSPYSHLQGFPERMNRSVERFMRTKRLQMGEVGFEPT